MEIERVVLSPEQKALRINLDQDIYGTFAEIGAGQEVVRHFFRSGGASGTIAKTMSAYDKDFSDAIYGKEDKERYVCKSRLDKNYQKTIQGHGWLGVKFQTSPESKPSTVVIHIRLHENDSSLQQLTSGVLGVNLLYACLYFHKEPKELLKSLYDNITRDQIEIDMIELHGPDLKM